MSFDPFYDWTFTGPEDFNTTIDNFFGDVPYEPPTPLADPILPPPKMSKEYQPFSNLWQLEQDIKEISKIYSN